MKDLRIGQVSLELEKKLKVSSTNGKSIYIGEELLNAICIKYPKDYLKFLSLIRKCIKKENEVSYLENEDALLYQGDGILVKVKRMGKPKRWYLEKASIPKKQSSLQTIQ